MCFSQPSKKVETLLGFLDDRAGVEGPAKMKHCELFLLFMIMDSSTNAEEVTCQEEELNNTQILVGHPGITPPYKSGQILVFRCTDVNMKMSGQRLIECQSNGKWDNPYPQCEVQCRRPPSMVHENADTKEMTRNKYNSGEKVEYVCFNKYVMEGDSFLTCVQGKWRGHFTCLKPCTVTVDEMDKRNIQLKKGEWGKIFAPYGDYISFVCQWFNYQKGNTSFRQMCRNGV
ncbi:coagulation factor XIII B chain-like [Xyrauchen texanus]|uniref:coagulation factor XIII B chain-like n=1 Tax=Xyrauchen texanus TaxID=154827 RepID=UPI0022427B2B|nr:coagulation factor XIII B chain-like [Xyrauchen texanus]